MNEILPSRFVEHITRLALGIEATDALRGTRISHPIGITFDELPLGLPRPRILRHDSCVFVLLYGAGVGDTIQLRLFDSPEALWRASADQRRFVPRRLRIPLLAQPAAESRPYTERVRRPVLFPGAAYDTAEAMTGLRGRVEDAGQPVRWARVTARDPVSGLTVGRAQCDDRGEFLLLIESGAGGLGDLTDPLELEIQVHTPNTPVVPAAVKALDPLWDLPVESVPAPGLPDPVCAGALPWSEWSAAATTTIEFTLGRLLRSQPPLSV
jgi:hypothetical protein